MIIRRIIIVNILPGIKHDPHRWRNSAETKPTPTGTNTSADRLKHKYNSICTIEVSAPKKYIEYKVEWNREIDLVSVPNTSALGIDGWRQCITITTVLRGCAIQYISIGLTIKQAWKEEYGKKKN
jgi:hypothetical protein